MATAGWLNTAAGITAALTGPLMWALMRRHNTVDRNGVRP
jgi:hypothetical protein